MTIGLVGVTRRPLHEVEAMWKADGRLAPVRGQTVSLPCLCGGRISAHSTNAEIQKAVRFHNGSTHHSYWATASGWRQDPAGG